MTDRIAALVGRRGTALLFLAFVDFVFGWSLANPPPEARLSPTLRWLQTVLPLRAWAILWVGVGVVLLFQAFAHNDKVGFAAASLLKVLWGLMYLGAAVFEGVDRAWVSAFIWLCMAGWIHVISTWPEPPPDGYGETGGGDG